jgi:hypothetical protein
MRKWRFSTFALSLAVLHPSVLAQTIQFKQVPYETIEARLKAYPGDDKQ